MPAIAMGYAREMLSELDALADVLYREAIRELSG